jgi:FKBP-type peptidyl-prolyl cis-trans isomerase (trigger factor)
MEVEVKRDNGDAILTVKIPAKRVGEAFAEIKKSALKEVAVPGFRKGKAPKNIAEKRLDEDKLAEALFNRLIPAAYAEALEKEKIKPIVPPQIKITSFKKDADLIFEAKTAEKPEVKLGNYEDALRKIKGKIIYGPDGKPLSAKDGKGKTRITAGQVLDKLREIVEVAIPPMLIEQEIQRMLSALLNQTQTLGITVEQYLAAEGKNIEQLRKEYRETAERGLKDEFIISEIAHEKKMEVGKKEIEDMIAAAPDETSRKEFAKEGGRRYIETVMRKRKTIEHLLHVVEGKK